MFTFSVKQGMGRVLRRQLVLAEINSQEAVISLIEKAGPGALEKAYQNMNIPNSNCSLLSVGLIMSSMM